MKKKKELDQGKDHRKAVSAKKVTPKKRGQKRRVNQGGESLKKRALLKLCRDYYTEETRSEGGKDRKKVVRLGHAGMRLQVFQKKPTVGTSLLKTNNKGIKKNKKPGRVGAAPKGTERRRGRVKMPAGGSGRSNKSIEPYGDGGEKNNKRRRRGMPTRVKSRLVTGYSG